MISQISFPSYLPSSSNHLSLTLISLEEWVLVTLDGPDSESYLQSQFTCDIFSITPNILNFAAHCNKKGKTISIVYVFYYQNKISFITRRNIYESQILLLRKYSIFHKTNIFVNNQVVLLGMAGIYVQEVMKKIYRNIPDINFPVVHHDNTTLLYFNLPSSRFLIITTLKEYNFLKNQLHNNIKYNNSKQWLILDIEANYPIIDYVNQEKFIPQSLNLQILNGINFRKGCYIGQEIVMRMQHQGINKRSLYCLMGVMDDIPKVGEVIEIHIENIWKKIGTILAVCMDKDKKIWIQAVLYNNVTTQNILRVSNNTGLLRIFNKIS